MPKSNAFDRLTELAAAMFDAPIALITVLETERQWFRAKRGYGPDQTTREESFCAHMAGGGPGSVLVVEDAMRDGRFEANRLVTDEGVRFYAGALITTADGTSDGAVCVIDTKPRPAPTAAQMESLRMLARIAGQEIDNGRLRRLENQRTAMLELAEAMAGVGHWRYEIGTGDIAWSDEVYRIHGCEPGTVIPREHSASAQYHPDDRAEVWRLIERAIATGEGYDTRLRLTVHGVERVTRTRARVERDDAGAAVALFGVYQDITEAVRGQTEQQELVDTLKLAGDLAGLGSWKLDVLTGQVRWSEQVFLIHGVDPQTFDPSLGDAVGFYHPDDRQAVRDWIGRAIETGEGGEFRLRLIRADGEERIVVSQCRPERRDGQVVALYGVFQDVTERVRAEEIIRASEARYRLLADNATDVIAVYGMDGVFRYLSPAIEQPMGYRPDELIGRAFSEFMHPEDVARVQQTFMAYAQGPLDAASPRIAYRAFRKGGEMIWLEAHPKLIRDANGRPLEFQDVVRDITVTKALEDELIAARDTAQHAARAKSEFLANMSHELRTPLTSVIGFSGLMRDSAALPETERRYADRIATASEALLGVINDILDYSKLEAEAVDLDPVAFDPAETARGAAAMVEAQCQAKGIGLVLELNSALPDALMGDEGRIRQVMLNFLSNAVKFTVSGEVRLEIDRRGDRLRVAVSDSGIGIAADKIDTLFERFTQADASTTRVYGGTGLGLAISRRLIEMMGGEIGATSRPGEGSTFWFEVPLPVAEASAQGEARPMMGLPAGLRVLMADDAAANRELVRIILEGWDVRLQTVENGAEAVQAAGTGEYDLILMDVHMPVMDGMDATRAIRAMPGARGQVPILALTANVQPEQVQACRAAGMDAHIGKPIQIGQMIETMSDALASRAVPEGRVDGRAA